MPGTMSNDLETHAHSDALCIEADYREEMEGGIPELDFDVDDSEQTEMSAEEFERYMEIRATKGPMPETNQPVEKRSGEYVNLPPANEELAQHAAMEIESEQRDYDSIWLERVMEFRKWQELIMDDVNE